MSHSDGVDHDWRAEVHHMEHPKYLPNDNCTLPKECDPSLYLQEGNLCHQREYQAHLNHDPKVVSPRSQVKYNECILEERVKMATRDIPAKTARLWSSTCCRSCGEMTAL